MKWRDPSIWCLTLALCGCARGISEITPLLDAGGGGGGGGNGEDAALDGMVGPSLDSGIKDAGNPNGKDAGMVGKDAGSKSDAGSDAGGTMVCTATNMCSGARALSEIAGDTGSDTQMATGMRGEWLSIAVTDTGGVVGTYNATRDLRARLTLTSSGGANYDLFMVRPPNSATGNPSPISDCGAVPVSSELASGVDSVSTFWPDKPNAALGEGAGDAFTLSIEVRHVSGPCGSWNLTVEGNK